MNEVSGKFLSLKNKENGIDAEVRTLHIEEHDSIKLWWEVSGICGFNFDELPFETTVLALSSGVPMFCLSLILTNCKIAWIECFVGNPEVKSEHRRNFAPVGLSLIEGYLKHLGFNKIFCLGSNESLSRYFGSLGFRVTLSKVDTLLKEI